MIDDNCTNKMIQLKDELTCQRKLLNSFDLEVFDRQWGIEPNLSIITSDYDRIQFKLGVHDKIHKQITLVKKDVYMKEAKMKITTDENVGLEILHLFIKDLLGKTTPAAKIFNSKADEDFEHTKVVTRLTKRLAILVLVVINVFFIYYSILIGFRRGISWQQSYLFACILQFIAEILFNETLECIWIQCVIPMLVKDEIRKVGDSITEIVNELCSQTQQDDTLFLNAPDYLFVSTNLAKKFPDLMESIVVQSYFTHLPGEISKLWNNTESYQIAYNEHRILYKYRIIMFITTIFTILQYLGTAPFLVHRLFIRVIQPFAFGVIVFLWSLIISSPIYISLMSLFIISILCLWVYEYIYGKKRSNKLSPIIVEMDNQLSENKTSNGSYLLCKDDDNAEDYVFNDIDDDVLNELHNQDDDHNDNASGDDELDNQDDDDNDDDDISDETSSSHESTDIENNHNNDAQVESDNGNFNLENFINVCEIISVSSNTDDKYEVNNIMINNRNYNEILLNQFNDENDYNNNYDTTNSNNDIMSDHCNSCFNDSVMQDMSNDELSDQTNFELNNKSFDDDNDDNNISFYIRNSGKSDLSGDSKSISSCFNDSVILEIFNEEMMISDLTDQEENNQITIV